MNAPAPLTAALFAAVLSAIALGAASCSTVAPSSETPAEKNVTEKFDLAKCQVLEPSLYRCPGVDSPLCDPDFNRFGVQCLKVTKSGVLLQELPFYQM